MELKDIVAVSGQSGLHKIIGRTKNGLILETIGSGKKFATGYQDRVSILEDISMYTQEGDMRLSEVLVKAHTAGKVPTAKDDAKEQRNFLIKTIGLDSERVYDSDIKKFFNWYNALKDVLDFSKLGEEPKAEETTATETSTEETAAPVAEEKPKKAAAKKTAAKKVAAPKSTAAKTNTKGAGAAKTTYRPKSV